MFSCSSAINVLLLLQLLLTGGVENDKGNPSVARNTLFGIARIIGMYRPGKWNSPDNSGFLYYQGN